MRCLIVLAALLAPALADKSEKKSSEPRTVDLVICLDVSGSMDGLINSARARIWSIVNDLALAKPTPRLRVGLIAYGGTRFQEAEGWVNVETAFTEGIRKEGFVAVALFRTERVDDPDGDGKIDAIRVSVEHESGRSVDLIFPFDRDAGGVVFPREPIRVEKDDARWFE